MQRSLSIVEESPIDFSTSRQVGTTQHLVYLLKHQQCGCELCFSEVRGGGLSPDLLLSKVFIKVEMNYLEIEKYIYALVVSTRKLHSYFHTHDITILTN